jgi:selenocysteine lyase/cysteine desulfurase
MDRRRFFGRMLGGAALSLHAWRELNASIYEEMDALDETFQMSPDGVYWDAVKKHFHLEDDLIMMNNGTVGAIPKPVFNTMMENFEIQLKTPCDCYMHMPRMTREVRPKLAEFIGAEVDEVAITRNTTEGMNFIANGLALKEGDEIIMSSMEHPGGINPWGLKAKRYGVKIKEFSLNLPTRDVDEVVSAFKKQMTPRTKVLSISHTVYKSGLIAPLKELSEAAHEREVFVLADAAHAIGMLDLDMHELGVDAWCTSPYKWLGAPPGVGVLYVRKEVQDNVWPTIASSGWDTRESAGKFETVGQRADALIIALGEALDFQNHIGKGRIERRVKTLALYLKEELEKIPGVKLHTSKDPYLSGGLTAFSVEGVEPAYIVDYLREKYNLVIRTIGTEGKPTHGVRVSTHIYTSLKDVDLVLEGVRTLAKKT